MARTRTDFPPPDAIRALADAEGRLTLHVTPGTRSERLEISAGRLLVKVRATPEGGKANAAVLEMLGKSLGISTSRLRLLRGATSREKVVQIDD